MGEQKARGRRWLRIGIIAAAAIVVLVALAPTVVGWFAPGFVAGAVRGSINGNADVKSVSLSWFGGQRIGPITISDVQGKQVADITVTLSRSLPGLIGGAMSLGDLGQVTISGSASISRGSDGTLNVASLPKSTGSAAPAPGGHQHTSAPASSPAPIVLPAHLKATLILDKLSFDYIDDRPAAAAGVHRVAIQALSGSAAIDVPEAKVDLNGAFDFQRTKADPAIPGGSLAIKANVSGLTDSSGKLTPDTAKLDADVEVKDLAVAVADALAGLDNKLVAGIGEKFQASIKANGTMQDAQATILASSRAVNVDLAFKSAAGVLTSARPDGAGTISVQGGGLMPLIPGLQGALAQGGMILDRLPDFRANVGNLRIPLPINGKPLDLRGGALAVALQTTEVSGEVRVPQADGTPGPAQAMKIAPLKASVSSEDLGKKIVLAAATSATIGGQSAGALSIDLTASDPLDAAGKPRAGIPGRVEGSAMLSDVATALAQPLLERTGIQLARDVGPRLDLALKATSEERTGRAPADSLPPTHLALDIKSAGLNASARILVDGTVITTEAPGAQVEMATAIAQPIAERMGLDLTGGIGPRLTVTLTAAGAAATASGGPAAAESELTIKSAGLNGAIAFTVDDHTIRHRASESSLSLRSPATLAGKAARNAGVALSDGGYAKVTLKEFTIVCDQRWSPRLEQSAADVELNIGGFSITTLAPAAQPGKMPPQVPDPVALNQMIVGAKLAPGASPAITLRGSGKQAGADFFLQGALEFAGLIGKDGELQYANLRPIGTIDLNNMPTTLAAFGVAPAAPGQTFDTLRLLHDAVGPAATIKLALTKPASGGPSARAISLNLTAANFSGTAAGSVDDAALSLTALDFRGQVHPELAATLIDMLGAGLESKPTLISPATLTISATPFTIPLSKSGGADLARAGDASFKAGLEGKALVNNVVLKGQDGKPRDLGTVGLENVLLTASVPLSSLAAGSAAKPAQVSMTAGVLGDASKRIVDLKAGAKVNLAGGAPQGDLNADVNVNVLDAAWIDTFVGRRGLLADGCGPTQTVDAAAVVQFPKAAPAKGGAAPLFDRAAVTASVKSAHLTTTQQLKATAFPDHFAVDSPMIVKWTMPPSWGNRYALAPPKPGDPPIAKFTAPTDITLSLFKLAVATGPDAGPFKPGVFMADVQIESPGTTLSVGSGKEVVPAALKNFKARVTGGKDPGTLGFSLTLDDAGGGPGPGGKPAASFSGGVYGIADSTGKPTFDAAKLTMTGAAAAISTAIVDALGHQGGLLTEGLGPKVDLDIKTEGLSKAGGTLNIVAVSSRAEARVPGTVRNGAFVVTTPAGGKPLQLVTLNEATPQLGKMLVQGLPAVGSFEKRKEDGPATVNVYSLAVPIDGDLRKLNGQMVVDLGAARFATSEAFGALMKIARQNVSGQIGRHMDPFEVTFKNGVGSYDKVLIPLGEFRVGTSGTFDLVNRQMDVVTYIPFGALTDEAAGKLNSGLGKFLNGIVPKIEEATMVPFRTRGSFDSPKTEPDVSEFGKNFIKTLRPDQIIKDIFKK